MSMPANGAIIQSVSQTNGAIAYVGIAYMNNKAKAVSVSFDRGKTFMAPTPENAKNKLYPVVRPLRYNGQFIQYLNQLTDEPVSDASVIFSDTIFATLHQFLKDKSENYFETQLSRYNKIFSLQVNIFADKSFEIMLNDITRQEKTKQLKQEMTGNITHELRTPVTGIRAYLETVLQQDIPEDKKEHFIKQAYNQTLTLSEILKDMSLIAKIEEASASFALEKVNISELLGRPKEEWSMALSEKNIEMNWQFPDNLVIKGNPVLLHSIFNNLTENAIRYAGEHIKINISVFNEDYEFYYFSFYDTGAGIGDEGHLNRIFERFYRVQEGHTREAGGLEPGPVHRQECGPIPQRKYPDKKP